MKSLALSHTPTLCFKFIKGFVPTPNTAKDRVQNINTGSEYNYQAREQTIKKINKVRWALKKGSEGSLVEVMLRWDLRTWNRSRKVVQADGIA